MELAVGMKEPLEFNYSVVNLTPSDLHGIYEIATWLRANCLLDTYGFDLQTNTWKFSRQEDYVQFILTWTA